MAKYKVISFDKIPSTQDYALNLVAHGTASDCTAVVARAQSSGRGRYKRRWVSHHGNLYVSFIFSSPERDSRLAYVIAVAVAETLISFGVKAKIKWPNDILIDGAKISGILIEYAGDFVITGIGININSNPTVSDYKTTKLSKYVADVSDIELLRRLIKNIDKWRLCDFVNVRKRWTELAIALNQTIRYQNKNMQMIGLAINGALILRDDTRYIMAWGDEIKI